MRARNISLFLLLGGVFLLTEGCPKNFTTAPLPPLPATPTPSSTATANSTLTPTKTPTSTATLTAQATRTATSTATSTASPTPTNTLLNTATSTATSTPRNTTTASPTASATSSPTATVSLPSLTLSSGAVTTLTTGSYTFSCVNIASDAMVYISGGVTLFTQCFTLAAGATITGVGQGYPGETQYTMPGTFMGPDHGNLGGMNWPLASGGGHGGAGGNDCDSYTDCVAGGAANDNAVYPTLMGSAGAGMAQVSGPTTCGAGGALLEVVVYDPFSNTLQSATINGTIDMSGAGVGNCTETGDAGGGAGGTIWFEAQTISGSGWLTANGGYAGSGGGGGGGGGIISLIEGLTSFGGTISVNGGRSFNNAGYPYINGSAGTITFTAAPSSGY